MKKEQENKMLKCLYVVIVILCINTICHFVTISKLDVDDNKTTTENTTKETDNYDTSSFATLTPAEITKKIKNGDEIILFIGQEKCTYCQKMLPVIKQAQTNFGYKTVYLDVAKTSVNSSEYKEMASLLDVEKTANGETKEFGKFTVTPMTAVIKNGKMIDGMIGYNTYDNFVSFLEKSGVTKK